MTNKYDYSMIRSLRLAGYLMFRGFPLINTSKDKDNELKSVYWFLSSDELVEAIRDYSDIKNRYASVERFLMFR